MEVVHHLRSFFAKNIVYAVLVVSTFLLPISPLVPNLNASTISESSIVLIKTYIENEEYVLEPVAQGSGVIISSSGVVLTNAHVVTDESTALKPVYQVCVTRQIGQEADCAYIATLIAANADLDVALIKLSSLNGSPVAGLNAAALVQTDTTKVGDPVTAVGYPTIGGSTLTTTSGTISGKVDNLYGKKWIKSDAVTSFGSSGGALFNDQQQVIGITTAIHSDTAASLGYAVSSASLYDWVTKHVIDSPDTSNPLTDRVRVLANRQAGVGASSTFDDPAFPFTVTKPESWKFKYVSEHSIATYNPESNSGGYVTFSVRRLPFAPSSAFILSFAQRLINLTPGASSLVSVTQSKDITVGGSKGMALTFSTGNRTLEYYFVPVKQSLITISKFNGDDNINKEDVDGVLRSFTPRSSVIGLTELKEYTEPSLKLSLKSNKQWVFERKNNPSVPVEIYHRTIPQAFGRISYASASEQTAGMNNQQFINYIKQQFAQSNQIARTLDYQVSVVKTAPAVSLNTKVKNVIRVDYIEQGVANKKTLAYDTEYYIHMGDTIINANLTVYTDKKAVYTKALTDFNGLLKSLSLDVDRRVTVNVNQLIESQKFADASKIADQITDKTERAKWLAIIIDSQLAAGKPKDAVATALKMLKLKPKDHIALNYVGFAYSQAGDNKNAEKYLLQSIKVNGKYRAAHNNLGNVYNSLKKYDLAEKEYKKAIDIEPANPKSYPNIGYIYINSGRYDLARDAFERALALHANSPLLPDDVVGSVYYNLGYLYCNVYGEYQQGVNVLKESLNHSLPSPQSAQDLLIQCQSLLTPTIPVSTNQLELPAQAPTAYEPIIAWTAPSDASIVDASVYMCSGSFLSDPVCQAKIDAGSFVTTKCAETDSGDDPNVKGVLVQYMQSSNNGSAAKFGYTDYCEPDGDVVEYYCANATSVGVHDVTCAKGCSNGSCIQ